MCSAVFKRGLRLGVWGGFICVTSTLPLLEGSRALLTRCTLLPLPTLPLLLQGDASAAPHLLPPPPHGAEAVEPRLLTKAEAHVMSLEKELGTSHPEVCSGATATAPAAVPLLLLPIATPADTSTAAAALLWTGRQGVPLAVPPLPRGLRGEQQQAAGGGGAVAGARDHERLPGQQQRWRRDQQYRGRGRL